MVRFEWLERYGVTAAMSGQGDGDCALVAGRPEVQSNRTRVAGLCCSEPQRLVGAQQVHGTRVARVELSDAGSGADRDLAIPETDGLATAVSHLPLTITIADCVPLFLLDPDARVGALVHAGRVGTQLGIARETVHALEEMGGEPARTVALIGPSAGPCCYEVGEAMAAELDAGGTVVRGRRADLWATNLAILADEGIRPENIRIDGRCTICQPGFFSHRRDADGRRNMALLMLH